MPHLARATPGLGATDGESPPAWIGRVPEGARKLAPDDRWSQGRPTEPGEDVPWEPIPERGCIDW